MTEETFDTQPETHADGCRPPLWLILVALVLVVVALFVMIRVAGVLVGLVFLPDVPLPGNVSEIHHENESYGVDTWTYTTDLDPCAIITFYEAKGAICQLSGEYCSADGFSPPLYQVDEIAICEHLEEFSVFGLRWQVTIPPIYASMVDETPFTVLREVLWGGMPPPTIVFEAN